MSPKTNKVIEAAKPQNNELMTPFPQDADLDLDAIDRAQYKSSKRKP